MAWFRKPQYGTISPDSRRQDIPGGLWVKCTACGDLVYRKDWEASLKVCPNCNYYSRLGARERLDLVLDHNSFKEYDANLTPVDFLNFTDSVPYKDRLTKAQENTGFMDACLTGEGRLSGHLVAIGALDFFFMGGSMGSVVGEKITRLIEQAAAKHSPLIIISASGGARMQEGVVSLMQMAKTSAAIARFSQTGGLYLSVLTDPATGGVMASFASLGDIIIAEEDALIGFAGPRVIEQTIRQKLPGGFQKADFVLEHGLIDMVVKRSELRDRLAKLLEMLT
ncbi:MAG: acetyl-CoA carboxylase, carboxyltransferase subunit beta [bacterium]|nr:acetyl-CoA carboxylase, carboxyltransferase subunit beta [bacterium]